VAQRHDPGHVAGQEAHQPRGKGDLTAAEQGHVAHAAQGERPPHRAVAPRHQRRHQQRLGQPPLPVASGRREQRVGRRQARESRETPA
jgi:hypothetical protein